jgi:hypothetical protein
MQPSNFVIDQQGHLKLIDFDEAITFNKDILTESDKMKIVQKKYGNLEPEKYK